MTGAEDIVPDDEGTFAFTTTFEVGGDMRLLRTTRLLAGLVLVATASAVLIIIVVRALAILLPKIFPAS